MLSGRGMRGGLLSMGGRSMWGLWKRDRKPGDPLGVVLHSLN